jgi:WD40 repeat protein
VCIGGTEGVLKIFCPSTKSVIWESSALKFQVSNLLYDPQANSVLCTTSDQNIIMHTVVRGNKNTVSLLRARVLVGDLDQISDVSLFGDNCERVVVATNSRDIKLWNSATNDWKLLCGHTGKN